MRPFVAREILSLRTYGQPAVAPDGRWAVLVDRGIDAEHNRNTTRLMRWSLEHPDTAPAVLTHGPSDESPAFSPDGRHLAFLSKREGAYRQVYILPLDGGEAVRRTDVDGGVKDMRWLADSSGLVLVCSLEDDRILPAADPKAPVEDPFARYTRDVKVIDRMLYKMDGEGFLGRRRDAVCLLDLGSGAVRLIAGGPFDHRLAFVEAGGAATVVIANRGADPDRDLPRRDLWRIPHDATAPERLTDLGIGIEEALVDGAGTVYLLAVQPDSNGYEPRHLYRLSADRRTVTDLSGHLAGNFGDESAADVPVPQGRILQIGARGRPTGLWSAAGSVSAVWLDLQDAIQPLADGPRVISGFAESPDGALVLCAGDPTRPGYVSFERAGETLARHEATPDWDEVRAGLAAPEHFVARADGGPDVDTWYLPPASDRLRGADGKIPAVLEVHGGPMGMYAWRFDAEFHLLSGAGYGVVYGNPRGSTGYGDAFSHDIMADWGNHDYADVMAELDAALALHPEIDSGRLGVAGGSYGGFMVNWIVGHTGRFAAAVTMRSVVNRLSAMGSSDMGFLRIRQFGGKLWWEDLEPYLHQSPLMWASHITTPLLIEHQEGDMRCPIEQGEQLYMALKVLGREVRFVRYPDEFHGMSRNGKPWHRVHRLMTIQDWLDGHLGAAGGAPEEAGR